MTCRMIRRMEFQKHHLVVPFYLPYLIVDQSIPDWNSPYVRDALPGLPLTGCEDWDMHEEGVRERRGFMKILDDIASLIEFGTTRRWNRIIP